MATNKVGNALSNADFAADSGPLQLWEDSVDGGTPGSETVQVVSKFEESMLGIGWTSGTWNVTIEGQLTGKDRFVISANASANVIEFNDSNISGGTLLIKNLIFDGTATGNTGTQGINEDAGFLTLTIENVEIRNMSSFGLRVESNNTVTDINFDNIVSHNNGDHGISINANTGTITADVRNCNCYKNAGGGYRHRNNSGLTINYYNSTAGDNTLADWDDQTSTLDHNFSCVASDTSLSSGSWTSSTTPAESKTSFTTYFLDYANNNFALKNDDNTLWGIDANATIPTLDANGITRTFKDIGAYDHYKIETVGDAASGADFAADAGPLQLWENDWDGDGDGNFEAKCITDFEDTPVLTTPAATVNVFIHGDTTGPTRRKITPDITDRMFHISSDLTTTGRFEIEDLDLDGAGDGVTGTIGLNFFEGYTEVVIRRTRVTGFSEQGIKSGGDAPTDFYYHNVISDNNLVGWLHDGAATTVYFRHCGAFKNTNNGFNTVKDGGVTDVWGCVSMDNGGNDYNVPSGTSIREINFSVSSDTSATDSDWEDSSNNNVISKTTFADYFTDFTNDDFHLKQSGFDSWGKNPNAGVLPVLDLDGVIRGAVSDIGPLEFIAVGGAIKEDGMGRGIARGVGRGL